MKENNKNMFKSKFIIYFKYFNYFFINFLFYIFRSVDYKYPVSKFLDLMIGTNFYYEKNFSEALNYYNKFFKVICPD